MFTGYILNIEIIYRIILFNNFTILYLQCSNVDNYEQYFSDNYISWSNCNSCNVFVIIFTNFFVFSMNLL